MKKCLLYVLFEKVLLWKVILFNYQLSSFISCCFRQLNFLYHQYCRYHNFLDLYSTLFEMEKGFLTDSDNPHNSQNLLLLKVFCQSSLSLSSKPTSRLYKSLESGNGTKISDEKWRLVKLRYLENKKWWKGTVKNTRIMNT